MFFYSEPEQYSATSTTTFTLIVNSASLAFPNTYINGTNQKTFSVRAEGNTSRTIRLTGGRTNTFTWSPATFALTGGTGEQIVTVNFNPTDWGVKNSTIVISGSDTGSESVSLAGVCVADPLIITSSVNSIGFANTYVNATASSSFIVSAGGAVQDIVLMSDDSDQFDFSPTSFSLTGANQTQTVNVYFTPTSTGAKIGVLMLSASGGDVAHVSMSGSSIVQPDQYSSSVSLLLKGNGANNSTSFVDSSINNFTVSRFGNAVISTSQFKYGTGSMYFDGNSDYITAPGNSAFNFGSGSFTVEMWVNPAGIATNGQQKWLFGTNRNSSAIYSGVNAWLTYSTAYNKYSLALYAAFNSTSWTVANINITSGFNISPNTWTHLAFVREGNIWSVFVNGTKYVIGTFGGAVPYTTSYGFGIGSTGAFNPLTNGFQGHIDDFRVTKGIARYSSNFTPPTSGF